MIGNTFSTTKVSVSVSNPLATDGPFIDPTPDKRATALVRPPLQGKKEIGYSKGKPEIELEFDKASGEEGETFDSEEAGSNEEINYKDGEICTSLYRVDTYPRL